MRYHINGESQENEIKTIKQRQFNLNLSDDDVIRLFEKAGSCNMTVESLLENFIGDLVCGTYSNGSDEVMHADNWFERCGFSWMYKKTFLTYLLRHDLLEHVIGIWEDIVVFKDELQYSKSNPEEFTNEEIDTLKNNLEESQGELNSHYTDYQEWAKDGIDEILSLDEEMNKVLEWVKKRDEKVGIRPSV